MEHVIAYLRVSTRQQQRSGLGIDAQRAAIERFAETESAEFVEFESGKGTDALERRPQLAAALAAAKTRKCSVVVAKLDRLSRGVFARLVIDPLSRPLAAAPRIVSDQKYSSQTTKKGNSG
jgi:DNA invertase Pin-like site-specific DNA recombinase